MKFIRSLRRLGALTVVVALSALSGQAQALCAVTEARYSGGSYGAQVVASPGGCFRTPVGGTGSTSVQQSDSSLSASANLSTGVMTAWSSFGSSSSAMWDTVHFSGLSGAGADVVARLSMVGHISGGAVGNVMIAASRDLSSPFNGSTTQLGIGSADPFPSSVDLRFTAHNGDAFLVYLALSAFAWNGVADLSDPPTLSFLLPQGASFTSDSGVLLSGASPTPGGNLPEPSTLLLASASLMAVMRVRRRR